MMEWHITLMNGESLSLSMWLIAGLTTLAFMAGFMDAIVGGGGLMMVPGLLTFLPSVPIPVIFGTNKLASVAGTTTASLRFAKSVPLQWSWLAWSFLAALICAIAGGKLATMVAPQIFRPLILMFLLLVAWLNVRPMKLLPTTSTSNIEVIPWWKGFWGIVLTCSLIGFYDGFIGPGTGVFLIFAFVRGFGLNFLQASAHAKWINMASNIGALIYFLPYGLVIWQLAIILALANMSGAYWGAHLAIKKGARFIQIFFRVIVGALLIKFAWDTFNLLFH